MKTILMALFFISLTACKTSNCPLSETIAKGASQALAKAGDCERPDLIEADIMKFLDSEGTCSKPQQSGPIAMIACPLLSKLVTDFVWKKAIKQEYLCHGGNAKVAMELAITAGCNLIPF